MWLTCQTKNGHLLDSQGNGRWEVACHLHEKLLIVPNIAALRVSGCMCVSGCVRVGVCVWVYVCGCMCEWVYVCGCMCESVYVCV